MQEAQEHREQTTQMVSNVDRTLKLVLRDQRISISESIRTGRVYLRKLRRQVLSAYRSPKRDPLIVVQGATGLANLIEQQMVRSHLRGISRTVARVGLSLDSNVVSSEHTNAIDFLANRMKLSSKEVEVIEEMYSPRAIQVTSGLTRHLEKKLSKAMTTITELGLHVKDGAKLMGDAFDLAGLDPLSPNALEAVMRTNSQMAYSVGAWQANEHPDVGDLVWGYKYAAVGDDRMRPTHAAMDGTILPKDHPFWVENYPPNGWNCRCIAIAVTHEDKPKEEIPPKSAVAVNGKQVPVVADEGFRFHPGKVFKDSKSLVTKVVSVDPDPVVVEDEKDTTKKKKVIAGVLTEDELEELEELNADRATATSENVGEWTDDLTPDELANLEWWIKSSDNTEAIRHVLAGNANLLDPTDAQDVRDVITTLKEQFRSAPAYKGTVYRGSNFLPDDIKVGGTLEWNSFKSSSKEASQTAEFGDIRYEIETKSGLDLGGLSLGGEQEVILDRDAKYEVIAFFEDDDHITHVKLREIFSDDVVAPIEEEILPERPYDDVGTLKKWVKDLSTEDRENIDWWVSAVGNTSAVRKILTNSDDKFADHILKKASATIKTLEKAFKEGPVYRGYVYRATEFLPEGLKVGGTLDFGTYKSTSQWEGVVEDFGGRIRYEILTKTGLRIGRQLEFEGQSEVILDKDAKYIIRGIDRNPDEPGVDVKIELEEIEEGNMREDFEGVSK